MSSLVSAIEEWASEDVRSVDTASLGSDLVELRRAGDRLEAEFVRRLAEFDRRGGADADVLSTAAWLRHRCRLSPGAAAGRVAMARRLDAFPATASAFAAGDIGLDHVRAITLARDDAVRTVVAAVEETVVEHASATSPMETARLVRHVVNAALPEVFADDAEVMHERRRLHVSETFDGAFVLDGLLDPEAGATLRSALHALMAGERKPGDPRTPAQARADALTALARRALDAGELPETAGERPHVTLTVDLTTLQARPGAPAGTLGWAGPVPGETARRLACDARVTRVVTGPASQPLDLGRTTRVVPPAVRRALDLRDRGCVWPGCDRPPPWTDAHHVRHWADGGPTSLANLVLLCRRHHRAVHEGRRPCPTARAPAAGRPARRPPRPGRHGARRVTPGTAPAR